MFDDEGNKRYFPNISVEEIEEIKKNKESLITDSVDSVVHEIVKILKDEDFKVVNCNFCSKRVPKNSVGPRECPVCGKLCFPKNMRNN